MIIGHKGVDLKVVIKVKIEIIDQWIEDHLDLTILSKEIIEILRIKTKIWEVIVNFEITASEIMISTVTVDLSQEHIRTQKESFNKKKLKLDKELQHNF